MIALSLSEAGALAFKAARGAGMEWGMAEEARVAVVWTHGRGLPGLQALLAVIQSEGADANAGEAQTAALGAGVALSDTGVLPPEGLHFEAVVAPILLLPFVAHLDGCYRVQWRSGGANAQVMVQGDSVWCSGDMTAQRATRVSMTRLGEPPGGPASVRAHRAFVDGRVLAALERLAQATYAPATDASRERGAGGADDV